MRALLVVALAVGLALLTPPVNGTSVNKSQTRARLQARTQTAAQARTQALLQAHEQALAANRAAIAAGGLLDAEVLAWQQSLARSNAALAAKAQAQAQADSNANAVAVVDINADAVARANANANAYAQLDSQVSEESLLQTQARAQVAAGVGGKALALAGASAQAKAKGDDDAVQESDIDYFLKVMVSPDYDGAGTEKPVDIKLSGPAAQMAEAITLTPGLSLGETLDLVVSAVDVGKADELELSMPEDGDDALVEVVSIDQFPMNGENGESKYINFANPTDHKLTSTNPWTVGAYDGYVVICRTSNFIHGGTQNPISIKFIGTNGASSVMTLTNKGFAEGDSTVFTLADEAQNNQVVGDIVACVVSVTYTEDDVWMPDTIFVLTSTQRVTFRNSDSTFIGFKPQKFYSDKVKGQIARAAAKSDAKKVGASSDLIKDLIAALKAEQGQS